MGKAGRRDSFPAEHELRSARSRTPSSRRMCTGSGRQTAAMASDGEPEAAAEQKRLAGGVAGSNEREAGLGYVLGSGHAVQRLSASRTVTSRPSCGGVTARSAAQSQDLPSVRRVLALIAKTGPSRRVRRFPEQDW